MTAEMWGLSTKLYPAFEVWMNVIQHSYEMLEENLNNISSMILCV